MSIGNEVATIHAQEIQNRSLTTRYYQQLFSGHPFFSGGHIPQLRILSASLYQYLEKDKLYIILSLHLWLLKINKKINAKSKFPRVLNRKRNRHMLQKRGFLTPKRNFSSLGIYHLDWEDLFLSTVSVVRTCSLCPRA